MAYLTIAHFYLNKTVYPTFPYPESVQKFGCFEGVRNLALGLTEFGQGYCRLYAQTIGQDGERFCCFTNPIWARITDGKKRRLFVRVDSK